MLRNNNKQKKNKKKGRELCPTQTKTTTTKKTKCKGNEMNIEQNKRNEMLQYFYNCQCCYFCCCYFCCCYKYFPSTQLNYAFVFSNKYSYLHLCLYLYFLGIPLSSAVILLLSLLLPFWTGIVDNICQQWLCVLSYWWRNCICTRNSNNNQYQHHHRHLPVLANDCWWKVKNEKKTGH